MRRHHAVCFPCWLRGKCFCNTKYLRGFVPSLTPDLTPEEKWGTRWAYARRPAETGLGWGRKGLGPSKWPVSLGALGGGPKRGTLGSSALYRHISHSPFLPSLVPEAGKEGGARDAQQNGQPPSILTSDSSSNPRP